MFTLTVIKNKQDRVLSYWFICSIDMGSFDMTGWKSLNITPSKPGVTTKEHLEAEEYIQLIKTPCEDPEVRDAFIFSPYVVFVFYWNIGAGIYAKISLLGGIFDYSFEAGKIAARSVTIIII